MPKVVYKPEDKRFEDYGYPPIMCHRSSLAEIASIPPTHQSHEDPLEMLYNRGLF
jgi:hypothetical protein